MITPTPYVYHAHVNRVIDGDSIVVDITLGRRVEIRDEYIRLYRINAYEVRGEERDAGLRARAWLRERVEGQWVVIQTHLDRTGKYGRLLADVYHENICLNDELVRLGHAVYQEY